MENICKDCTHLKVCQYNHKYPIKCFIIASRIKKSLYESLSKELSKEELTENKIFSIGIKCKYYNTKGIYYNRAFSTNNNSELYTEKNN